MSLQIAAQHLASRGRGPDTQLVHMAPQEVAGLNALARAHGGSLTTNPDTGLPEAGFLSKLLPTLIGAGLSIASGGTLTPMMAAMLTGGGYGLATGSLKKGLMAGLGAYGGAGLAGGLSAAGTAAAGAESVVNPLTGMEAATLENAAVAPAAGVEVGAPIVDSANLSQTGPNLFGSPGTPTLTAAPAAVAPPPPPQPQVDFLSGMDRAAMENKAVSGFNPANTGSLENAQRGLSGLMNNPASRDAFMTKMGGGTGLLKTGMMAAAPVLLSGQDQDGYKGSGPNPYEYSYDYRTGSYTRQAPGYRDAQTVTPPRAMADGGYAYSYDPVTQSYGQMSAPDTGLEGVSGSGGNGYSYSYDPVTQTYKQLSAPPVSPTANSAFVDSYGGANDGGIGGGPGGGPGEGGGMGNSGEGGGGPGEGGWAVGGLTALARGGQSHLGDYSDGGRMLRGPGDGVSDSIPATIGGKRPARLADGEFVVPARVVSELGNGSSEAGARKLYAMMDRVQNARKKSIGKNKVAVNSRAAKLLPA